MLVLTRRPHEKILIPAIQACIHVAAIQPGVVRVAIDAPREVTILRGELQSPALPLSLPTSERTSEPPAEQPAVRDSHRRRVRHTRKRLEALSTGLGLVRLQLRAGLTRDAQGALAALHAEIQSLRRRLEGKRAKSPTLSAGDSGHAHDMDTAEPRSTRPRHLAASVC